MFEKEDAFSGEREAMVVVEARLEGSVVSESSDYFLCPNVPNQQYFWLYSQYKGVVLSINQGQTDYVNCTFKLLHFIYSTFLDVKHDYAHLGTQQHALVLIFSAFYLDTSVYAVVFE